MEAPQINIDTLKKNNWSSQEQNNVSLVADFMQHLMNKHDFEYVMKNFHNAEYIQHNRSITNGIEGLVKFVKQFAKSFPEYSYDVKHIYADGDYVIFHSHATLKKKHRGNDKKGMNIIDTWKIRDGKIVEHWDSLQPIDSFMRFYVWLTGGSIRNQNGVF